MTDAEDRAPRSRLPRALALVVLLGGVAWLSSPAAGAAAVAIVAAPALWLAATRRGVERVVAAAALAGIAAEWSAGRWQGAQAVTAEDAIRRVHGHWESLVGEASRMAISPLPAVESPRDAFDGLEALVASSPFGERTGIALLGADGSTVAWSGAPIEPEPANDDHAYGTPPMFSVRRTLGTHALHASAPDLEGLRTVDLLLEPVADEPSPAPRLPSVWPPDLPGRRTLTVAYVMSPETRAAYERLLGDSPEPYRSTAPGRSFLHMGLRAPDGTLLAVATIPEDEGEPAAPGRPGIQLARILAASLALWLLATPPQLAGIAIGALLGLAAGPLAGSDPPWVTGAALAGLAAARWALVATGRQDVAGGLLAAGAGLLAGAGSRALPSSLDLYRFACLDPWEDRLTMGSALVAPLAWGVALMGLATGAAALLPGRRLVLAVPLSLAASIPMGPGAEDPVRAACVAPLFAAAVLAAARGTGWAAWRDLAGTVLVPAIGATLGHAAATSRLDAEVHQWLRQDARRSVERLAAQRARVLAAATERLALSITPAAMAAVRAGGDERAYTLWLMSGLAELQVDSALGLFSEAGDLVGAFAHGFPRSAIGAWDEPLGVDGTPQPLELLERTELRRGIAAQVALPRLAGISGWARVAVANDLPSMQGGPDHRWARLLSARLDAAGRSLWSSTGDALAVDPLAAAPWDGGSSLVVDAGGDRYLAAAFLVGEERVLLGLRRPPSVVVAAGALGSGILGSLLGLLLASAGRLAGRRVRASRSSLPRGFRVSYRSLLLVTTLGASLLPTLAVSFGMERLFRKRVDGIAATDARHGLETARRLLTELLWGDRSLALGDARAELVRDLLQADVDIHERGTLVATSRRQLVELDVVSRRIPSHVYVSLELEGRPFVTWTERGRAMGATSLPLGSPMRRGVLVMPLSVVHGDVREEGTRIAATARVMAVLMGALALGLATMLAGGFSRPLLHLTEGASRIRDGKTIPAVATRVAELRTLGDAMQAMSHDLVAERRALLDRGRYIETILDNATGGVVSLDADGIIRTANPSAQALLGIAPSDVGAATIEAVLAREPALRTVAEALLRHRREDARATVDCDTGRETLTRLRVTFVPFTSGGARGSIMLADDVTDVARMSRIAAWADAARTVAHEVKNPLTPILLHADHLERVLADAGVETPPRVAGAVATALRVVREQVAVLKQIATQFSLFAKPPAPRTELVDLGAMAARLGHAYATSPEGGIAVTVSAEPGIPAVLGSSMEVERAVRNLVQNAFEALGRIPGDRERRLDVHVRHQPETGTVVVDVTDSGDGVDAASRARIFEPYFSTKDAGSGLGLALARKIALDHGGDLRLLPSERGAHFRLELPVARSPA